MKQCRENLKRWANRLLVRLAEAVLTIWLLVTLCFFLLHAAPGGPFDQERSLAPELEAQLQARFHLDQSLPIQYFRYMEQTLRGDLGPSFQYLDYSVNELIANAAPITLTLGLAALLFATLMGIAIGAFAAWRGGWIDWSLSSFSALGLAIPKFVLAPILILLIAVHLNFLPAGGWDATDWRYAVLPIISLAMPIFAVIAKMMRASTIEILNSDYVRAAKSRGVHGAALFFRHVVRPASLPVVAYLAPAGIALMSGSTVVETVFGVPGLGRYFVQGALNRDYTLVLGVALVLGVTIVLINLLIDAIRVGLDPRLRQ